jgi:hypothetical protein
MDADFIQLQMVTRLKLQLKRRLDIKMDIRQFMVDRAYALEMLRIADESDDEDLIMYAIQVSGEFTWLSGKTKAKVIAHAVPSLNEPAQEPKQANSQYLYGTRG